MAVNSYVCWNKESYTVLLNSFGFFSTLFFCFIKLRVGWLSMIFCVIKAFEYHILPSSFCLFSALPLDNRESSFLSQK